jgi:hypothetical protein
MSTYSISGTVAHSILLYSISPSHYVVMESSKVGINNIDEWEEYDLKPESYLEVS